MKKITVSKGAVLQRKGDINSNVFIVEDGLLRSYTIDDKGKEHIYMFGPENWFVADNCEPNTPGELFIDAIEDSILKVYSKEELLKESPDINALLRRLNTMQTRILMLMSSSAKERYEHFIKTYPNITQRVPLKMIASYLGVTPEALSRVRHELSQRE
ncbi:Crp/Fnr family transcriptional regulator [Kriegella aquimaris]|uniref:cAMP-binding domain of CRP or a regulatory subunit of cAMP-dependent protein kinases n=1 Tax=Kriegella aquimaris TaxID=192904 RepID=A0A1G9PYF9_9FLAO|nr:Crp/Fnr family transcriptional regulator [Kriegella aquimaris]SDM03774.1 cAMP-binding domain of CRP or a regulatory subunit of cAMP-dependent protein kinases [Kriegella aquimaris]